MFFLEPLKPILPAEDQEITSPLVFVNDMMILLKEAVTCASPIDSTITFRFLLAVLAIIRNYYLVTFFLFATVLRLPFLVRELFFVRCPRNGRPALCLIPR